MDIKFVEIFPQNVGEIIYLWFDWGILLIIQMILRNLSNLIFENLKDYMDESQKSDQFTAYFVSLILSSSGWKNSYLFFSSYLYKISGLSLKSLDSSENHRDWYIKLAKPKKKNLNFTVIDKMVNMERIALLVEWNIWRMNICVYIDKWWIMKLMITLAVRRHVWYYKDLSILMRNRQDLKGG